MALGADEFSEIVVATLEKIQPELYDQVTTRHPTLDMLRSKQNSATGRKLVINLELAEDTSTEWSDASGSFSTAVSGDILGAAVYDWADPLVSHVRLRWKEIKKNSGEQQIVDLVQAHINRMMKDHKKKLVNALHALVDNSSGTSDVAAGQFLSLDQIVSDSDYDADPHGDATNNDAFDVGGIDASVETDWQASRIELPLDGTKSIRQAFRHVSNEVYVKTDGDNQVDKAICGRKIFEEFEDSFDDKVRYTDFEGGQTRFPTIRHGELEVTLDPDCPERRAYFLDTDALVMKSLAGAFMERQETQMIEGTLDKVTPAASVLATGTNERRASALLLRPTTTGAFA